MILNLIVVLFVSVVMSLKSVPMSGVSKAIRVEFFGDEIDRILEVDALTGKPILSVDYTMIFPATHYAIGQQKIFG